ncbi:hypothetical protein CDN99_06505 [Roseateles aquatilis]|uniref:Uncharacterized protein n=1 Tax=Roseateles aquatilis TaxID=431061 RepID=A0A246JHG2_9BURK|nr:hypothetical protein [Roseateles aquatilis]OWQ92005.1 hypothetical protein CDN99_06505 [Roseateles aquatilis]
MSAGTTTVILPVAIVETMRDLVGFKRQQREYDEKARVARALRAEAETTLERESFTRGELQAREQEIAAQRLALNMRAKLEDLIERHAEDILSDARFAPVGDWGPTHQRREVAA